jgi:multisubunit Na+/H+ antiporter MnhG subunit
LAKVWKKLFRGWKRIKLEALDFLILVGLGMLMIFLAGPIESYVSPRAMGVFLAEPLLAGAFLLAIGFFYSSLAYLGFRRMRENLRRVLEDLRLCVRGKFRSSQVSVLMLFVLLSVFFLAVVF